MSDGTAVAGEGVNLSAEDGFEFNAYKASAQGETKGGLVVLQEIFGVTDQLKGVAERYAAQGFDAIVPALFDRTEREAVIPYSEAERGRGLAMGLDPDNVARDVAAAMAAVDTGKAVSLMGFCWGGHQALRLASILDFKCSTAFYGTRLEPILDTTPKCPMLFHFGETDDHSPPEIIEAVRRAFPRAELHVYDGAGHAFANDARPDMYVPDAAELAHNRTAAFLSAHHAA